MQKSLAPSISRTTTPIPNNQSTTDSDITGSTVSQSHSQIEHPFVQDDVSNYSYPSVLALKLSFTNKASNETMSMVPKYVHTNTNTLSTQNGEKNESSLDSEDDNNGFYGLNPKQQSKQHIPSPNHHFLSPTSAKNKYNSSPSSMYDYADKFDPPHTALTPHRSPIPIVLQSVIEDLSDNNSLEQEVMRSKNKNWKRKQSKVKNEVYKQKMQKRRNSHAMNMELKININNDKRPKKRKPHYNKLHSSSVVITPNKQRSRRNFNIRRPHTSRTRAPSPSSNNYKFRHRRHRSYNSNDPDLLSNDSLTPTESETSLSTNTLINTISDDKNINPMLRSATVNSPYPHKVKNNNVKNIRYKNQRPVPIIRRPITKINNLSKRPKKYGLYDNPKPSEYSSSYVKYGHKDKQSSMMTDLTLSELKDRFLLGKESKYRSYTDSELSTLNQTAMKNMNDALCVSHNGDHHLCKKAIQDAFEKGFYTGMFLASRQ